MLLSLGEDLSQAESQKSPNYARQQAHGWAKQHVYMYN